MANARFEKRRLAQRLRQFSALFVSLLCACSCLAGVRHFTYVYEAITSPPGSFDLENWITWRTHAPNDRDFDQIDLRHELEFGITDNLQAAIYVADWNYQNAIGSDGFSYSDSAIELIYNLTNPVIDPLGLSIYQEYSFGERFFAWESKVIAQKNFGPLILAYNATLESVWEGKDLRNREGEVQQALGASYEISPRFSTGLELVHETVFADWRVDESATSFFVGPNISLRRGTAFITLTALAQATRVVDEPDFQMRTIFGIAF